MKLIIGLGNPGPDYQYTRHNMGFMVIDALAQSWKISAFKSNFQGEYALDPQKKVILFKPLTFMNLSGHAVQAAVQFYKISTNDIVVIYDDLAFAPGIIKLRLQGSSGSHNGMQHIIESLHTESIPRIRIGIGPVPPVMQGKDYVLQVPGSEEMKLHQQAIRQAVQAVEDLLIHDFSHAMSRFNRGGQD